MLAVAAFILTSALVVAWLVLRPVPALGNIYFGESKAAVREKLKDSALFNTNGPIPIMEIGGESYLVLLTLVDDKLRKVRLVCLEDANMVVHNARVAAARRFIVERHGEPGFTSAAEANGTPIVGQKVFLEWRLRAKRQLIRVWQADSFFIDVEPTTLLESLSARAGPS
jgi:hypothetical protein